DVRAPPPGVPRAAEDESLGLEPGVEELDRVFGERGALPPDLRDPRFGGQGDPDLDPYQAQDRRRPDEPACDAHAGIERGAHRELVALAEPALDRVAEAVLDVAPDEEERRGAGSG